jgi:hypothetical protein
MVLMSRHDDFFYRQKPDLSTAEKEKPKIPANIRKGMLVCVKVSNSSSVDLSQVDVDGTELHRFHFLSPQESWEQAFMVVRVGKSRTFMDVLWGDEIWRILPRENLAIIPVTVSNRVRKESLLDEKVGNPYGFSDEEMETWVKNGRLGDIG